MLILGLSPRDLYGSAKVPDPCGLYLPDSRHQHFAELVALVGEALQALGT